MKHQNIDIADPLAVDMRDKLQLDGPIASVKRTRKLQVGDCYQNVRNVVNASGGSAQLGWILCLWPDKYLEALHHAVWRTKDGELEDVTASSYQGMEVGESAFIEDKVRVLDADFDPHVPSTFILLSNSPKVTKYAELLQEQSHLIGWLEETGKTSGTALVQNGRIGFSFDNPTDKVKKAFDRLGTVRDQLKRFRSGYS